MAAAPSLHHHEPLPLTELVVGRFSTRGLFPDSMSTPHLEKFFQEPARALTRNALIIAIGFLPMLFASLTPYIIVGALLASIMLLSWLVTLLLLPALIVYFGREERGAGETVG